VHFKVFFLVGIVTYKPFSSVNCYVSVEVIVRFLQKNAEQIRTLSSCKIVSEWFTKSSCSNHHTDACNIC